MEFQLILFHHLQQMLRCSDTEIHTNMSKKCVALLQKLITEVYYLQWQLKLEVCI